MKLRRDLWFFFVKQGKIPFFQTKLMSKLTRKSNGCGFLVGYLFLMSKAP